MAGLVVRIAQVPRHHHHAPNVAQLAVCGRNGLLPHVTIRAVPTEVPHLREPV